MSVCVSECVSVCVCVSSRVEGRRSIVYTIAVRTGSRNGVEGRGSRDGECVSELESEYEWVRTQELI